MDFIRNRPELSALIAFIIGLVLGWIILGWYVFPVNYVDGPPWQLHPAYKGTYIETAAVATARTGNPAYAQNAFRDWPQDTLTADICAQWSASTDPQMQNALESMVGAVVPGASCATGAAGTPEQPVDETATQPAPDEGGGPNLLTVLFLLLVLLVILGLIYYVIRKRNAMINDEPVSRYEMPDEAPTSMEVAEEGVTAVPIARFNSTYSYGRDNYDDSFSIENTTGDFLGECGVGISESIGTDTPKNVTALEVWLFDKNDIRTETKVLMSDHAFFDEALKAKLAPKGEPVLARENEVIVLETAALIINAVVKEMQYGTGDMPPQSYFETITLEISAWAKEATAVDDYDDDMVADDTSTLDFG